MSDAERLFRDLAPSVLGALMRRFRDFAAAEDALQEALLAAAVQWPRDGAPDDPRAWLIQVAARRMTDAIRSESARRHREAASAKPLHAEAPPMIEPQSEEDETLALLFMCCHPALTKPSAIALTLRAIGGLTTAEIARAFLVPEATMAQRISRAKAAIRSSGVSFSLPSPDERKARLSAVLHTLYLIFNEGYVGSSGPDLVRPDLSAEAVRLTRSIHRILPHDGDVEGLLALMLLTEARRPARTGPAGELIPLDEQDRTLWNRAMIGEGVALVTRALSTGPPGIYQLQAAIAAIHDEAERVEDTDWPQILALYEVLKRAWDNPVVMLNHAVAAAMVHGPSKGLEILKSLEGDPRLAVHHRSHAVRARLYELAGDHEAAIVHYREAAARTASLPERNDLLNRLALLIEAGGARRTR